MFGVVRVGIDTSTGHGCFPPTNPNKGSMKTFVDGLAHVRVTDTYNVHCCMSCHVPNAVQGSQIAFIDGLAAHCQTHKLGCGDAAATGSPKAFIGK